MKEGFYKNTRHGFIVKIEKVWTLKLNADWISTNDAESIMNGSGKVVYDPKEIWGVGYESENWAIDSRASFEEHPGIEVEVDTENEMWEAFKLGTDISWYGGYVELGEHRNYRVP